jgi:hypothetical protein
MNVNELQISEKCCDMAIWLKERSMLLCKVGNCFATLDIILYSRLYKSLQAQGRTSFDVVSQLTHYYETIGDCKAKGVLVNYCREANKMDRLLLLPPVKPKRSIL